MGPAFQEIPEFEDIVKTSDRDPNKYCAFCGGFTKMGHVPGCPHKAQEDMNRHQRRVLDEAAKHSASPRLVIPLPPEVEQYAPEIARFVEAMVYKLSVHASKGKWESIDREKTIELLKGEVEELEEALQRGNMVETLLEAADVGNYALIIAAKVLER